MKKIFLFTSIVIFLSSTILGNGKGKMLEFLYLKPYKYELINGSYKVKAIVKSENWIKGAKLSFEGEVIPTEKLENGDMQILLPLVGNPGFLKITSNQKRKNSVQEQHFEPLIPADWNYFANGKVHLIVSSHQDIGWMNTPDSCRVERVHKIVLPALDLIEEEPEFKFEMEQSLNLMEALEDSPENKQRLIDTYKSGNFEWGATFNQPYEGLESGEQLVRQSYLGRRWIKKNLPGMDAHVAYNVDIPGRSLQVPQLFKKSGIDYLFVSRMTEGFYKWYSPDGTGIFTYSPGNYGWFHYHHKVLDEDAITALHELHKILKNWNQYYSERNIPPHYAAVISADAGGPKYYKEVVEGWNEIAKNAGVNIPEFKHSTAIEFLHEVDVPEAKIDSIYGERPNLWLYIHGPAHYEAIKAKKEAAVNIPAAEIFNTINCELNNDFSIYPQRELDEAWFGATYPDHGWGGLNGHITDSLFRVSLEKGNETGKRLLNSSLKSIVEKVELKKTQNIVVFNDLSWNRDGYAKVDISHLEGTNWVVVSNDGKEIPTQLINNDTKVELVFSLTDMPSVGYKTFNIKRGKPNESVIREGSNFCDNQFYIMKLGQGGITRLYDKVLGKEIFNTTSMVAGDMFNMGYTGTGAGEFVTMTPPNFDMERAHEKEGSWSLIESGAIYSKFQSEYEMDTFSVKQSIIVYHQKKQIDLEYTIPDWPGATNRQLRILFPLQMKSDAQISYDVPMGMVHVGKDELTMRPGGFGWGGTYRQKSEEIHPREIQNFMTANGDGFGFTMSTNVVTADYVDPSMNAASYPVINSVILSSHHSCYGAGSNWYHQKGSHTYKFSITSHEEGWKNGFHFGVESNHPFHPVVKAEKQKGELPAEKSFVSTSNPFAVITTIKKAEDDNDVVIRLLEAEGEDKEVNIILFEAVEEVSKTDMIEGNPQKLNQQGKVLNIELGKHAVDTYKMK